jgi:hypothetical protein
MRKLMRAIAFPLMLTLFACMLMGCSGWQKYKEYPSPDGRYQLEVLRKTGSSVMPGQGGDAPGRVRLIKAGKVIREIDVDMASSVDAPTWTGKTVYLRTILEWPLE